MTDEEINNIEEKIFDIYLDLQVLYFSLQDMDTELELAALFNAVERIYKNTAAAKDLF